tara:strand:+ start:408 stop:530 length:123 start_codon:yes stop_codon:yes gene_type:complete
MTEKNNFDEIRESDGEWDKAYIEKLIKENDGKKKKRWKRS